MRKHTDNQEVSPIVVTIKTHVILQRFNYECSQMKTQGIFALWNVCVMAMRDDSKGSRHRNYFEHILIFLIDKRPA